MNKPFASAVFACLTVLAACAPSTSTTVSGGGAGAPDAYKGPRARIAVADLSCKASKCFSGIGSGMGDMMTTALVQSQRFRVLDRASLGTLTDEQRLGGATSVGAAFKGADVVITGAITAFEPDASGTAGGVGGIVLPVVGGVGASRKEAYIAADLRAVDVNTREVVAVAKVEGRTSSFGVGVVGGYFGGVGLIGGFKTYSNEPMEKAVSVMLDASVKAIIQYLPGEYYKY